MERYVHEKSFGTTMVYSQYAIAMTSGIGFFVCADRPLFKKNRWKLGHLSTFR